MREATAADHRAGQALSGRKVLLTGHTGFKGGWLALWLRRLGADICAVALPPCDGAPSLFESARIAELLDHRIADIGDPAALTPVLAGVDAEVIFHLAAQSLVRPSYADPLGTFQTNVMGTAAIMDAARHMPSLRAIVIVTSDKCYDNREWTWGYRECDPMGGADPYSASKGCAELVADAFRRSYFSAPDAPLVATVRAGNVFGGGDWSVDRLVPDIVRAASTGLPLTIRNPLAIRPWQHVLEPLSGYLQVATALMEGDRSAAGAWNFGPDPAEAVNVGTFARTFVDCWGAGAPDIRYGQEVAAPHEAGVLRLDSTKARTGLGWHPRLSFEAAVALTVDWYKAHLRGQTDMRAYTQRQIELYTRDAGLARRNPPPFLDSSTEIAACA
ncbi:CDP-glucose 4,6-dehydratase [Sphingomonas sp. OV641]|uniref:CDP-glucose 4,6-dehydratase n=1 Tax=Sphingomonas sp. OV641 TaxID=1881068 RepID=UPI0008D7D451|nr:CDP-glucose 4,6-dehydratase [Sphingomonas sp. OV641]SEI83355.1 CDP-glucose 4,6-dehydratase [Sphingomonas sp. OV641]